MLKGSAGSFGVRAPEGQQVAERDAELLPGVAAEVLLDQGRGEAVEAGGHRGVGGEEVAGPRGGQRGRRRAARSPA